MMCRFEFVVEMTEEDAQKIREQITDSCVWQVKLTSFFYHYFGVRVSGIHQFRWWVFHENLDSAATAFASAVANERKK